MHQAHQQWQNALQTGIVPVTTVRLCSSGTYAAASAAALGIYSRLAEGCMCTYHCIRAKPNLGQMATVCPGQSCTPLACTQMCCKRLVANCIRACCVAAAAVWSSAIHPAQQLDCAPLHHHRGTAIHEPRDAAWCVQLPLQPFFPNAECSWLSPAGLASKMPRALSPCTLRQQWLEALTS